jgi:CHAT domain-containing protein
MHARGPPNKCPNGGRRPRVDRNFPMHLAKPIVIAWLACVAGLTPNPAALAQDAVVEEADAFAAGARALNEGRYGEAQSLLARALDAASTGGRADRRRAEIALLLAQAHLAANDPAAARAALLKEWSVVAVSGEAEFIDRAHYIRMTAALMLRDFAEAAKHSGALADRYAARNGKDHQTAVESRINHGSVLINAGKSAEGMAMLDEALAAIRRIGGENLEAQRLHMVASALDENGRRAEAAVFYLRLIAVFEPYGDSQNLAITLFNLAVLRKEERRLDESVALHEKAIAMLNRVTGPDSPDTITAIASLGNAYTVLGRPASGVRFLEDAFERSRKVMGENDNETWKNGNNYANALRELERFEEARVIDAAALDWRLKNLEPGAYPTSISAQNLGLDHMGLKQYAEARKHFGWLYKSRRERLGETHALTRDAADLLALAESYDPQAVPSSRVLGSGDIKTMNRITANIRAGQLDQAGKGEEALAYHRRSVEASEEEAGVYDPTTLVMLRNAARAERHIDPKKAVQTYDELNRRTLAWARMEIAANPGTMRAEDIRRVANGMIYDIARFAHQDAVATDLLFRILLDWKGLGTAEQSLLKQLQDKPPDEDTAKLAERIRALQAALREPGAAVLTLEAELGIAEARLAEKSGAFRRARSAADLSVADARSLLGRDGALIDYLIVDTPLEDLPRAGGENVKMSMAAGGRSARAMTPIPESGAAASDRHVYALMTLGGDRRAVAYLGPLDDVVAEMNTENFAAKDPSRRTLYKLLLEPLFALPGMNELRNVYIVPDGELFLVPFEGLLDSGGLPFAEKIDVTLMRSASGILKEPRPAKADGGILVVGDPDYGPAGNGVFQFAPLPMALEEAKEVGAMASAAGLEAATLSGARATEAAIRKAAAGKRIVHMATHGFFLAESSAPGFEAPWRGGIALAAASRAALNGVPSDDGIAYAAELATWRLEGTDLVVLSACETGSGDRSYVEGLRGVPAALAVAGAERSLLALWSVPDDGAAAFMLAFYRHLWKGGMDYEGAYRAAKRDAMAGKVPGAERPEVWQAFVMIRN